ncbi:MAG: ABC transporter permease [Thermoleophilia bacterium]|nr:ABC transporter permease [Thermoleophilia bacterium]
MGRVLPTRLSGRRAALLVERNALALGSNWLMVVSGFFEPLFYLLSIGFGIGGMVGDVPGPDGAPIPYALFVAPALLASSSMNGAITECTFNVFFKLNYQKTYDAVLSTPMSPADVALGEIGWAIIRSTLYSVGFFAVILLLGLYRSPLAVLAIPAAMLLSWAFSAVALALTTWMRGWQDFDLIFLITLPLFLFSGTFYPISAYPPALQVVVEWSPLYQGVALIRALITGVADAGALVHVAYLLAMGLGGLAIVSRRLDRLLRK